MFPGLLHDAEVTLVSLVEQNLNVARPTVGKLLDEQIKVKILRVNPEFWLTLVGKTARWTRPRPVDL